MRFLHLRCHMPLKKGSSYWPSVRVLVLVGCISLWILLQLNLERSDISIFVPQIGDNLKDGTTFYSGFLVNTNGCRIPDLDPMDVAVRKFIVDEPPISCDAQYGPALVESNLTAVYINESVLSHYNVSDLGDISCCYRPFWREEKEISSTGKYSGNVDGIARFAPNCTPFTSSAIIQDEFVKVECFVGNSSIYKDYHAFTPQKSSSSHGNQEKITNNEDYVKVLIVGVDAVSRLNLHRQMPKTVKFLKKTLNAIEILGYNKVEDNTFPNLIPVVAGLTIEEITKLCWLTTSHVFDDCNFIWNNFSRRGYTTVFAEDASWMGLFSYVKNGFRKQPTDYYMRIFNKVSEDDIGFDKRLNANLCVGPRKTLETLLNYASKFLLSMKDVLTMAYFWGTSLSHDYLNLPKYGDDNHKVFFETMYDNGIFNNTVLVFLSDHGIRWGEIRGTYQGYLEERLPFLFVAYPNWFRTKYTTAIRNLKNNAHKLTTPFDLHELLLDLTNLTLLKKEVIKERSAVLQNAKVLPRGISLFLPIPENRTCQDAGIVDHWCTCHQSKEIPTNNTLVRRASQYLVKHINYLLRDYPQCVELKFNKIVLAREEKSISHSTFNISDAGISDLSITIQTTPGNGLFESTVRYDGNRDSFAVVGTISRINLYGDQSLCMPNYKLRLYCYCNRD